MRVPDMFSALLEQVSARLAVEVLDLPATLGAAARPTQQVHRKVDVRQVEEGINARFRCRLR